MSEKGLQCESRPGCDDWPIARLSLQWSESSAPSEPRPWLHHGYVPRRPGLTACLACPGRGAQVPWLTACPSLHWLQDLRPAADRDPERTAAMAQDSLSGSQPECGLVDPIIVRSDRVEQARARRLSTLRPRARPRANLKPNEVRTSRKGETRRRLCA